MVLPRDGYDKLLELIPEARRQILKILKRRGPLPVDAIAEALEITVSGARQHLTGLERDGVVTYRRIRQGPGRPRHLYQLTDMGDALFPRRYADLAAELLDDLRNMDPEALERLFARRVRRRLEEVEQGVQAVDLPERLEQLVGMLEDEGYMPQVEEQEGGRFLLIMRNCVVRALAERFRGACASEMAFLRRALPGMDVERVAHVLNGRPCCAYEVRPRDAEQRVGRGVDE